MNILVDGNYLFYKTLFIFGGYGSGGKILESKRDREMFMRKVATDFSHSIRTFGNPDRIVFTMDSRSWRKEIEIEEGAYKGHRVDKSQAIDWDAFYQCMNEFADILKEKGIIVSKIDRAEADDLLFLWSQRLYQEGMDSVIITGDRDLTQCVCFNNKNYVVVYNPNSKTRKIVAPEGFQEWLAKDDYDLFDASTYMNRSRDALLEAAKSMPIEEIDTKYVIFEKVITGDAGDAVPPIWTWSKDGKTYRVTASKAKRMYEILNIVKMVNDVYDLPNRSTEVSSSILATCKQSAAAAAIKSRLERNLSLVFLDTRVLPDDIQSAFRDSFDQAWSKKELGARTYDMNALLEGTKYVASGNSFESDIFSAFK